MELVAARQIIDTLAQGIHPVTGEVMPEDSPYNAPPVIRALFAVSQALDAPTAVPRARREPPPNAGKPWTADDDATLESAFAAGIDVAGIARELGRTNWAVEARLAKLGKIPPKPGMRMGAAAPASAPAN
jgi:hypothetical protein